MQSLIELLEGIQRNSTELAILDALNKVAANKNDPDLIKYFKRVLDSDRETDAYPLNVLSAGYFAACPGSKYMHLGGESGNLVNPFLHNLRKAMLGCALIREKLKDNASLYVFYPEFHNAEYRLRNRVALIGIAHNGADFGNDLLTVLYSLGGYFSKKASEDGIVGVKNSGGTTCVMTARGLYHAAGASMIGDRIPVVGTPDGPQIELGFPTFRTLQSGKRVLQASLQRDDQVQFGAKGFNDDDADERNRPQFQPGDVYYVDGEGEHRFLLRPGNAVAAHVGVIVESRGNVVDTVDGGDGMGGKISFRRSRSVKFQKGLGWTLDNPGKSFSTSNIDEVETYMAGFRSDDAVIQWMKQNPGLGKQGLEALAQIEKDILKNANNPRLVEMLKRGRTATLGNVRRMIREVKKSQKHLGQDRVLKGWWKPDRYPELKYCATDTIKGWLAAH